VTAPVFVADTAEISSGASVVVRGEEGHHATRALRLRPGEVVIVTDGCGLVVTGVVDVTDSDQLTVRVTSRTQHPAPQPRITVAQALPKGERAERAVELMAEVGVDEVLPWLASRSVVRWNEQQADKALGRWRRVAVAASKQSRRNWALRVADLVDTPALVNRVRAAALALLLDETAETSMTSLSVPDDGDVVLVVGPEGGVTDAEREDLVRAGAVAVHLGPTIMRTSTAGAVAAALVLAHTARWSVTP